MASKLAETIRRRVGGEVGVVRKEHGGRLRVCLVYPNTYRVGMSSLGFQTIYHLFNLDGGVVCERAFVPDKEDLADLERTGGELVSYESQTPLHEFDVVAFSVSYELDYVGVARVLRLAKVPVMRAERGEEHPLVMAGGAAVSINPEPLAELVEVFVIGEGEEVVGELVEVMRGGGRAEVLGRVAEVEGVWVARRGGEGKIPFGKLRAGLRCAQDDHKEAGTGVPALQNDNGRRACPSTSLRINSDMRALQNDERPAGIGMPGLQGQEQAPAQPVHTERPGVQRVYVGELDEWPTHSRVLTRETEFGGLFLVEVSRGCGRGCKFCVTPMCYWPLRWRSVGSVLESVRVGLEHRDAIGLVGAAVSDHPGIDEIARRIVGMGARLSVSSLRADSVSDAVLQALVRSGARSITIAPEAGTERLRMAIGKGITDEQILDCLGRAAAAGMREAKLYFMVGLPGEGEDDVEAIEGFVRRCLREAKLRRVTVAAGAFVPKPGTPYEREGMLPARELSRRLRVIREGLRREKRVRLALESANWSVIEGVLSRGDRMLGEVIVKAEEGGGNLAAWRGAMRDAGLTGDEYVGRARQSEG